MPKPKVRDKSNFFCDEFISDPQDALTFKELLNKKESSEEVGTISSMKAGHILKGTVTYVTSDFAFVEVGLKSEGLVSVSEFIDLNELIPGKVVEFYLDQTEGDDGQIVLSREKARRLRQWEHIVHNCHEGSIVQGKVIRKVKGGLMVDIGLEAFLPGSQVSNQRNKNLDDLLDKTLEFKILKINTERKNIVVSRRELLEDERITKKAEMLENIIEGEIRMGIVKNITDFGVFLDLDGIDGLLHITDMSWGRIKHPSEMVQLGQEVEVVILNVDREKGRVALGMKQKEENPWEKIKEKFPPGTAVSGKVANVTEYGVFLEIAPEIKGLIHITEMPSGKMPKIGEEIEAIVLAVNLDEFKISLRMKQHDKTSWEGIEAKYPIGKIIEVEVSNLTNYAAFVELEANVSGMIHVSDISWVKNISHPSEALKKSEVVKVKVLAVDIKNEKINLGMKQLENNPWDNIEKTIPVNSTVSGHVTKVAAHGATVELDNKVEALVQSTELSDQLWNKMEDVINVGDAVTAIVTKIDHDAKKVFISIKDYLLAKNRTGSTDQDDIPVGEKKKRTAPRKKAKSSDE